ncbi:MAG: hypothetical protein GY725_05230 [bacterium]|nr:hypothetical protein [bacterium]
MILNSYEILSWAHSGAAVLLLTLAIASMLISVLIAVKPAADSANKGLRGKANIVGRIENLVVGVVGLTGVVAVFMGAWSFSQFWLWISLVVVVFYSIALEFITRPARMAVAEGSSEGKVGLQVGLQVGHVLLLIVVFASMVAKPV